MDEGEQNDPDSNFHSGLKPNPVIVFWSCIMIGSNIDYA